MPKFYVEVKEEKKWIFPEIEAANVEAASDIALAQEVGPENERSTYVSFARIIV